MKKFCRIVMGILIVLLLAFVHISAQETRDQEKNVQSNVKLKMFVRPIHGTMEVKKTQDKGKTEQAELKEIVVVPTGNIEDESAHKIPAVVESLTPEGIERINAIETSDVFKYMPGSYLRKLSPGSTNSPLVIRGISTVQTGRVLVLEDGLPISDFTATGNSNAPKWQMIMPGEIDSVDVIYGPFSAALSGNSMAGSAIITTHMPEETEFQTDVTYTYQNFREYASDWNLNGYTANAYAGSKVGRFSFGIWAQHLDAEAQGTSYTTKSASSGGAPSGNEVTGWECDRDSDGDLRYILGAQGIEERVNDMVKAKIAYDLTSDSQIRFILASWQSNTDRDAPETYLRDSSGSPVYSGKVDVDGKSYTLSSSTFSYSEGEKEDILYGLTYDYKPTTGLKISATTSLYDTQKNITRTSSTAPPDAASGGAGSVSDNDPGWYTADLKSSYNTEINDSMHTFGWGYHFDHYAVDSETWNASDWQKDIRTTLKKAEEGKTQTHGVFVDDTWEVSSLWSVYLGGRYERWKGFDASKSMDVDTENRITASLPDKSEDGFSPKFSTTFKPSDKWRLRMSLAQATRYPTVGELYYGGISSSGIENNANPDLKPEKVFAQDFTITRLIGATGEARLTFFQDEVSDAIYSQTNTYTSITSYQNVDEVRTRGIELAMNERKFLVQGLGVFANVAYTDAKILSNPNVPDSEGKIFPRVAKWRAKCVLDYAPADRWFVTLAGHYSVRQYGTLDNSDRYGGYGGLDDYLIFDTKMSYRLKKCLIASLGVDNITNELVHVSHPYPMRTMFASLKYTY